MASWLRLLSAVSILAFTVLSGLLAYYSTVVQRVELSCNSVRRTSSAFVAAKQAAAQGQEQPQQLMLRIVAIDPSQCDCDSVRRRFDRLAGSLAEAVSMHCAAAGFRCAANFSPSKRLDYSGISSSIQGSVLDEELKRQFPDASRDSILILVPKSSGCVQGSTELRGTTGGALVLLACDPQPNAAELDTLALRAIDALYPLGDAAERMMFHSPYAFAVSYHTLKQHAVGVDSSAADIANGGTASATLAAQLELPQSPHRTAEFMHFDVSMLRVGNGSDSGQLAALLPDRASDLMASVATVVRPSFSFSSKVPIATAQFLLYDALELPPVPGKKEGGLELTGPLISAGTIGRSGSSSAAEPSQQVSTSASILVEWAAGMLLAAVQEDTESEIAYSAPDSAVLLVGDENSWHAEDRILVGSHSFGGSVYAESDESGNSSEPECVCSLLKDADAALLRADNGELLDSNVGRDGDAHGRAGADAIRIAIATAGRLFRTLVSAVLTGTADAGHQPVCGPHAAALCSSACLHGSGSRPSSSSLKGREPNTPLVRSCATAPQCSSGGDGCEVVHIVGLVPPPSLSPLFLEAGDAATSVISSMQQQRLRLTRRGAGSVDEAITGTTVNNSAVRLASSAESDGWGRLLILNGVVDEDAAAVLSAHQRLSAAVAQEVRFALGLPREPVLQRFIGDEGLTCDDAPEPSSARGAIHASAEGNPQARHQSTMRVRPDGTVDAADGMLDHQSSTSTSSHAYAQHSAAQKHAFGTQQSDASWIAPAELRFVQSRWWFIHAQAALRQLNTLCDSSSTQPRMRLPQHAQTGLLASLRLVQLAIGGLVPAPSGDSEGSAAATAAADSEHRMLHSLANLRRARRIAEELLSDASLVRDTYLSPLYTSAVYLPPWAPIAAPLLLAVVGGFAAVQRKRRQRQEKKRKEEEDGARSRSSSPLSPPTFTSPSTPCSYPLSSPGGLCVSMRPFRRSDAPRVRSLYEEGQRTHMIDAVSTATHTAWLEITMAADMSDIAASYGKPRCGFWVAELKQKQQQERLGHRGGELNGDSSPELVGFVACQPYVPEGAEKTAEPGPSHPTAELKRMCVAATHRRLGIASVLIQHLEHCARAMAYTDVSLTTLATMHAACALYERNGYSYVSPRTGVATPFGGHTVYVVELTKKLGRG